jgi:F0F1-type ATP synthase membrane subunit c/vacuolar-type H+-ATPase subunit K
MATLDVHAPTLGAQGEPCASCGAPLAADQRYCLECGTRREQARLPFRDILTAQAPPGAAPTGTPEQPARSGLAFLAGLLCLLAALGVGVLIGRSGDDAPTTAAPTPAPQVITVNGAAPATTTTPATSTNDASGAGSSSPSSDASGRGGSGAKSSKGAKSSNKAVKDLDGSSGSDYQKKSQKLPKEVGTGGKPPPKDNKPAGGGTDFEDIG